MTDPESLETIQMCVTEINSLLTEVQGRLAQSKKGKLHTTKKDAELVFMNNRLDRARKSLKAMRVEIRYLSKVEQAPHTQKASLLEEQIAQLAVDMDWFSREVPTPQPAPAVLEDHKQVLQKAEGVQDESIKALKRIEEKIEETKQTGAATLVEMDRQSKQIKHIGEVVDEVGSNLQIASRHIRTITRRLATDKIIMCLVFMIFAAIVFIICWKIFGKVKVHAPTMPSGSS